MLMIGNLLGKMYIEGTLVSKTCNIASSEGYAGEITLQPYGPLGPRRIGREVHCNRV